MHPKQIGGQAERKFAKKLSLWLTDNQRDDIVIRDASSGSKATKREQINKETIYSGDFILLDPTYKMFFDKFYLESKSFSKENFKPIMFNPSNKKSNPLLKEWLETKQKTTKPVLLLVEVRDGSTADLIMYENRMYLAQPEEFMTQKIKILETGIDEFLTITTLNHFLFINKPSDILKNLEYDGDFK